LDGWLRKVYELILLGEGLGWLEVGVMLVIEWWAARGWGAA